MNRSIEVLNAIVSAIGTNTTAGDRVYRGRIRPMTEDRRPIPIDSPDWINVMPGPIPVANEDDGQVVTDSIDFRMLAYLDLYTRASETTWDERLMTMWSEVHAKLAADYALGLAYVVDSFSLGTEEPEVDGEGDRVIATMRVNHLIHYRTPLDDLTT